MKNTEPVQSRNYPTTNMWEVRILDETYEVATDKRSKAVTKALSIHKEVTHTTLPLSILRKMVSTKLIPESDLIVGGL